MNDDASGGRSAIRLYDLAFDQQWNSGFFRWSDASRGGNLRRTSALGFIPALEPKRIRLAHADASAEQADNYEKS